MIPAPAPHASAPASTTRLLLAGALAFFAWLAWPIVLGQVYIEDDLAAFHLPFKLFYASCLAQGQDWRWTPCVFNGFYLHGEGQVGMLHPLNYALYAALPFPLAFMLNLLASYPLAFAGFYLLLRRWQLAPAAALFGALLFAFAGSNLNHYVHMHFVLAYAHLPWSLLAIDAFFRTEHRNIRAGSLAALIALSASQLLLVAAQTTFYAWLVEGLYAVLLAHSLGRRWHLGWLAGAKACALLLAMPQLLPVANTLNASWRAQTDSAFQTSISLHPFNLLQTVLPYAFARRVYAPFQGDEPWDAPYLCAAAMPLALVALLEARRHAHRRVLLLFAAIGVFGLAAALGRYGFLHYLLNELPVFDKLRAPARFVWLWHTGLAVLAAYGLARVAEAGPLRRTTRNALYALSGLVLALGVGLALWRAAGGDAPLWRGPLALLGSGGLVALATLLIAQASARRVLLLVLAALTLADLAVYGLRHKPHQAWDAYVAEIRVPNAPPGTRCDFDIHPMTMNRPGILGYRGVFGYVSLLPERPLDFTLPENLRLAGVEWREVRPAAPETLAGGAEAGFVPLADPLPRVRLEPDGAGTVQVLRDEPGLIVLDVRLEQAATLRIAESYHPGWTSSAAPIAVSPDGFLALPLHGSGGTVTLQFSPGDFRTGSLLALVGLLGTLGLVTAAWIPSHLVEMVAERQKQNYL